MVRSRSTSARRGALTAVLASLAIACAAPDEAPASTDDAAAAADSTTSPAAISPIGDVSGFDTTGVGRLPLPELLATFREGVDSVASLENGFTDRVALAEAYVRALATADTAGLVRSLVTRAEFGWIFYPDSPFTRPPYEMPPDIVWLMLRGNSERGVQAALAAYGGHPATLHGLDCDPANRFSRGRVTLWQYCQADLTGGPDATRRTVQLFGGILEVDGRVKFLSLGSKL